MNLIQDLEDCMNNGDISRAMRVINSLKKSSVKIILNAKTHDQNSDKENVEEDCDDKKSIGYDVKSNWVKELVEVYDIEESVARSAVSKTNSLEEALYIIFKS
jgi:hypothetical protein